MRHDWEGIPGKWVEDPTSVDGRRFVASKRASRQLWDRMRESAGNRCEWCKDHCSSGERHHIFGRGMGSGKREDRPYVRGIRFVVYICHRCHESAKIKPWGSWSLTS